MILTLLLADCVLAAPPPTPVEKAGRITVWIGDSFEHFKPDGGDVSPVKLPDGVTLPPYGVNLTANQKFAFHLNYARKAPDGTTCPQLVVLPLVADTPSFTLDGYVVTLAFASADGARVFFSGVKGTVIEAGKRFAAPGFVLDLATKKIESVQLPEKQTFEAASSDGKTFVTTRTDFEANTVSRRTYLVSAGGSPVEILKENEFGSGFLPLWFRRTIPDN